MKIDGATPSLELARTIVVPRANGAAWTLRLGALPLGFSRRLRARGIAPPVPPTRVARDSAGQPLKDRQGLALIVCDEQDADYLAEKERYQQQLAVLMIREALRFDERVEFEAQPPEAGDWRGFADALCREFESSGWSLGDVGLVCEEVCRLSNLIDGAVREAEEVFTPPAPAGGERPSLRVHVPSST